MSSEPDVKSPRLRSLDAYRGLVMLAMASGGAGALAGFADPGVGAYRSPPRAAPPARSRRVARGRVLGHDPAVVHVHGGRGDVLLLCQPYRPQRDLGSDARTCPRPSFVLIVLAVFLSSNGSRYTHYSFVNVLGQIGLGYAFVFLLLGRGPAVARRRDRDPGRGLAAVRPVSGGRLEFPVCDVRRQGPVDPHDRPLRALEHERERRRLLRPMVPQPVPPSARPPFVFNEGGYATLNFIPSMATMIFACGRRPAPLGSRPMAKLRVLLLAGAIGVSMGLVLDATLCPIVKRIWTPSWAIYSAGYACWMLGAFYAVIDLAGFRRWSFPLVVVGMNSIAIYLMAQLMKPFVAATVRTHLGPDIFSGPYGPLIRASSTLDRILADLLLDVPSEDLRQDLKV